jgi:hypothetical protein
MAITSIRGAVLILSLSILTALVSSGNVERSELAGTWILLDFCFQEYLGYP